VCTRGGSGASRPQAAASSRPTNRLSSQLTGQTSGPTPRVTSSKGRHASSVPPSSSHWTPLAAAPSAGRHLASSSAHRPFSDAQLLGDWLPITPRGRNAAEKRRKQRAAKVEAELRSGGEPVVGVARRGSVTPKTREIYTRAAAKFFAAAGLPPSTAERIVTPIAEIDRALSYQIDLLVLAGEEAQSSRTLFYAVRWTLSVPNSALRLGKAAQLGHARRAPGGSGEPLAWEELLLRVCLLLRASPQSLGCSRVAMAKAVIAMLLAFDFYARGAELMSAKYSELRPPIRGTVAAAATWTLNMFPGNRARESKTRKKDHLRAVGTTNAQRSWLRSLCPLLRSHRVASDDSLFQISTELYVALFLQSGVLGHFDRRTLHQLRHGGASADGAAGVGDLEIKERGNWGALTSVARYRATGRYIRALAKLSQLQLKEALAAPQFIIATLREILK
jgi:hypothetical protein